MNGLPVHESRSVGLTLPTADGPEPCRLEVALDDDGLEPTGSGFSQLGYGGGQEVTAETLATVIGGDSQAIDRSSPAVPAGYDRSHEIIAGLGNQEGARIEGDQAIKTGQIIGVGGFRVRHPPEIQHRREIGGYGSSYDHVHSQIVSEPARYSRRDGSSERPPRRARYHSTRHTSCMADEKLASSPVGPICPNCREPLRTNLRQDRLAPPGSSDTRDPGAGSDPLLRELRMDSLGDSRSDHGFPSSEVANPRRWRIRRMSQRSRDSSSFAAGTSSTKFALSALPRWAGSA